MMASTFDHLPYNTPQRNAANTDKKRATYQNPSVIVPYLLLKELLFKEIPRL